MNEPTPQRRVLFACTHNAGRSCLDDWRVEGPCPLLDQRAGAAGANTGQDRGAPSRVQDVGARSHVKAGSNAIATPTSAMGGRGDLNRRRWQLDTTDAD
jgi:hypothetical protein